MRGRLPGGRVGRPEAAPGVRQDASPSPPGPIGGPPRLSARPGSWLAWIRAQPVLTAAFLLFCVVTVGGLFLSLPRGIWSTSRPSQSVGGPRGGGRATPAPEAPAKKPPDAPAPTDDGQGAGPGEAGPWTATAPSPASPRGASLVHHYRTLPAGGESRYEWIVQVRGAQAMLDDVELVSWRMEPAAKNGAEFVSRDRAADGFPLFGHGPGGWFGVSATIRYRAGGEETLDRRVELPE